jgi:hypothetical protein
MRAGRCVIAICGFAVALSAPALGQRAGEDPIKVLTGRLELERYKATIKGLTQFGDRQQGTDRNRAAVDWIEAQLKSYGCSNVQRISRVYQSNRPVRWRRPRRSPAAKSVPAWAARDCAASCGRRNPTTIPTPNPIRGCGR